jgi:ABC-type multidrug transport system fused ATPase/permease subunit
MKLARRILAITDRRQKRQFAVLFAVSLISAVLEVASLGMVFGLVMALLAPEEGGQVATLLRNLLGPDILSGKDAALTLGISVIALYGMKSLLSIGLSWIRWKTMLSQSYIFAERLLERYLHRPWSFFLHSNTSDLLHRIMGQTNLLGLYLFNELAIVTAELLVIVAVLGFLAWVNPTVTLGLCVILGVTGGLLAMGLKKRSYHLGQVRLENEQAAFKTAEIAMTGAKEIRLNHSQGYFFSRFSQLMRRNVEANILISTLREVPRFVLEFAIVGGFLGLLGFLKMRAVPTETILSIAAVYAAASFRLLPSLNRLSQAAYHLRVALPLLQNLYPDLKLEAAPQTPAALPAPVAFENAIAFEDVNFSYPGAEWASLANITLRIPRNTSVGIVGPTGAGKTTLVEILTGLLSPDTGVVTVDGVALTADRMPGWQAQIGYVPQQIYLYDETILRNIAFGIPDAAIDPAKAAEAARLANIAGFIDGLPGGYQAQVGDRGVKLSGGQRQRLGIARALYRQPDVVVMDEATSALDTATEAEVAAAIRGLSGQKTLFIIAHRLSTVRHCDMIVVLEQGRIVATGTFDELQMQCEPFRRLIAADASLSAAA